MFFNTSTNIHFFEFPKHALFNIFKKPVMLFYILLPLNLSKPPLEAIFCLQIAAFFVRALPAARHTFNAPLCGKRISMRVIYVLQSLHQDRSQGSLKQLQCILTRLKLDLNSLSFSLPLFFQNSFFNILFLFSNRKQ